MPGKRWKVRVEDGLESQPFAVVDGIVLVVRTPRSRTFVTVEIGLISQNPQFQPRHRPETLCCSKPLPWVSTGWFGEVPLGEARGVVFELDGRPYHITLKGIHDGGLPPWATYEFTLEQGSERASPSDWRAFGAA